MYFLKLGDTEVWSLNSAPERWHEMSCGLEEGGGLIFSRKLKGQEKYKLYES